MNSRGWSVMIIKIQDSRCLIFFFYMCVNLKFPNGKLQNHQTGNHQTKDNCALGGLTACNSSHGFSKFVVAHCWRQHARWWMMPNKELPNRQQPCLVAWPWVRRLNAIHRIYFLILVLFIAKPLPHCTRFAALPARLPATPAHREREYHNDVATTLPLLLQKNDIPADSE